MTTSLAPPPVLEAPPGNASAATTDRPRRLGWVLGALLLVTLIAAHLALGARMRAPIIHPDELGYIDNARYLARGGLKPETQYYPGFSLLLVPVWWVTQRALDVWRTALVINTVLAAAAAVVTWLLGPRLVPELGGARRLLVTGVVALYPPFLLYSNLALAECLFVALFGVVVLLAARAFANGSPGWWAALGLSAGALSMVHPRGFAVVVAVVLLGAVLLWRHPLRVRAALHLAAGVTLSLAVTRILVTATRGPTLNGFAAYQPDDIVSKSLSLHGAASLGWELLGQMFYLAVATVGLVPLGLFICLRSLRAVLAGDRRAATLAQAFVGLSFVGVWALSSLFMNLGDRADKLIYGRYNEGAIIPLLVVALGSIVGSPAAGGVRRRARWARDWLLVGGATAAVTGAGVWVGRSAAQLHLPLNPVNVLGIYPLIDHQHPMIDVGLLIAAGIGALALCAATTCLSASAAVVVVAALFGASAVHNEVKYLVPGSEARARQSVIADALGRATIRFGLGNTCIGYAPPLTTQTDFNYFATRFLLPGQRFAWFDPATAQPCGPLVVSARPDFSRDFPRARLVTLEDDVAESLWVLPGPLQDAMGAAGWLLPPITPGPLPAAARHAILAAPGIGPAVQVTSGGVATITVDTTHDGSGSPWPADAGLKQGSFAVRLAVRWYAPGALPRSTATVGTPLAISTVPLPRTVLPGEAVAVRVPLAARDDRGRPLAPGDYQVRVVLYQESGAPFAGQGLLVDVTVSP